jgi:hypothetical protein
MLKFASDGPSTVIDNDSFTQITSRARQCYVHNRVHHVEAHEQRTACGARTLVFVPIMPPTITGQAKSILIFKCSGP